MKKETRQQFIFWLAIGTTLLSTLTVFGFIIAQAYIRWTVNMEFSFLGGMVLESLVLLVVAQTIALLYLSRT